MYQNINRLINRPLRDNVLDPSLVHIHGPPVLERGPGCVEVLGAVDLVVSIEEESPSQICDSCRWKHTELNAIPKIKPFQVLWLGGTALNVTGERLGVNQ